MKDFWKYWTLFIAIVVMPFNGYLLGTGAASTIFPYFVPYAISYYQQTHSRG